MAALFTALAALGSPQLEAARDGANSEGPLLAIVAPLAGRALNAPALHVQAQVAALTLHPHKSFVFNGTAVPGTNAGHLATVEIVLDGLVVAQVDSWPCRNQFMVDEAVDITGLGDGTQTLTLRASQGGGHARRSTSATVSFTLDRRLPAAERNRVEAAATPAPFACIAVRAADDDGGDGPPPPPRNVHGRIVLGAASDGVDALRDRIVIVVGSERVVIEPSALRCDRHGARCEFVDPAHPLVRRVELVRKASRIWDFKLRGGPNWPDGARLFLRIGNDWGGIDLATREPLSAPASTLDAGRGAHATIDSRGASLETVDSRGVRIQLQVPPGALTRPTLITMTPLQASPLAAAGGAAHPGVRLQPSGLVFAQPAILTLDFGAIDPAIGAGDVVFLVTSPMTKIPLYAGGGPRAGRVLTALLMHFSDVQGGEGDDGFTDLAAWAQAALASGETLTLFELQSLAALAAEQQQGGCEEGCLDLAALAERVRETATALASPAQCSADVASPSDAALTRLLGLETLVQQFGVEVPEIRTCVGHVLRALIETDGAAALADRAFDTTIARMLELASRAQQLGFGDLETLALSKVEAAMRIISQRLLGNVEEARGTDQEDVVVDQARAALEGALSFVTTTGAAVLSVAPTLAADLQAALDSLSSTAMGVRILPTGGFVVSMTVAIAEVGTSCVSGLAVQYTTLSGVFTYSNACLGTPGITFGVPMPPPVVLAASMPPSEVTGSVSQPQPDVVVVDVIGSGATVMDVVLELTFGIAGVLDVLVENPTTLGAGYFVSYLYSGALGFLISKNLQMTAGSLQITGPGTVELGVDVTRPNPGGRITFTFRRQ
jgi:hypothetical protein